MRVVRKVPTVTFKKSQLSKPTGDGSHHGMVQTETIANMTATYDDVRNPLSIGRICPSCMIEMAPREGVIFEPNWNPVFRDVLAIMGEDPSIRCHEQCEEDVRDMDTETLASTQGTKFYELWTKLRR